MPFIYRIANRTSDDVYYGSTAKTLHQRFVSHKNAGHQTRAKSVLDCPTAYIELVEEVNDEDRVARERWWVANNPCVNKNLPGGRPQSYYTERRSANKEKYNAYMREYKARKKLLRS